MFEIDLKSRKAIHEQITDNFKRLIITGLLKEDEKIPSIRELAKTLTVNPNTIQKSYRDLEGQGFFYTVLGQGSFVASPPTETNAKAIGAAYDNIKLSIHSLIFYGEPKEKIINFVGECVGNIADEEGQQHNDQN